MSYTHQLPLKNFNVGIDGASSWIKSNIPNFTALFLDAPIELLERVPWIPQYYSVSFSEQPSYEYLTALEDWWESLEDDGAYDAEQAKKAAIELEKRKIMMGIEIRAFLGYLCELNSFTPEQYSAMLADQELSFCSQLLISGALESCKSIIDSYTPTEYFTAGMKSAMSAELQKFIDLTCCI